MSKEINEEFDDRSKNTKKGKGRRSRRGKGNSNRNQSVQQDASNVSRKGGHTPSILVQDGQTNNDENWYTNYPGLPKDYASVAFNVVTGVNYKPIETSSITSHTGGTTTVQYNPTTSNVYASAQIDAGIMRCKVIPVLGSDDAVDYAATQLYTLVRKANSGSANYDKTDLMQMILAVDACYMAYEKMLRIYRTFVSYDYLNRYLPDTLLLSMGVDPDLRSEYKDMKGMLDLYAVALSSFCIPDQFDFIKRHAWLFTNVYCDEDDNGRSQLYYLDCDNFLKWNEGTAEQPTFLQYVDVANYWNNTYKRFDTVNQMRNFLWDLLRPLQGSEDVAIMNGDIVKAFGSDKLIKIKMAEEFDPLKPAHDTEVLEQIANANIIGCQFQASASTVFPDLSSLTLGPRIRQIVRFDPTLPPEQSASGEYKCPWFQPPTVTVATGMKQLLNMYDDIRPERVLTATRFKAMGEMQNLADPDEDPNWKYVITSSGTEVMHTIEIWYKNDDGAVVHQHLSQNVMVSMFNPSSGSTLLAQRSRFRYAPPIMLWNISNDADTFMGYLNDNTIIKWMSRQDVEDINNVCIISEYAVKDWSKNLV